MNSFRIEYEDSDLIVCYKPAGLPVQTGRVAERDLESELRNYLYKSGAGDTYIGIINRLDQPVEGLVLIAKSPRMAGKLSNTDITKEYMAVVHGRPEADKGRLEDYLAKDSKTNKSYVTDKTDKKGKRSLLEYEVVESIEEEGEILSLLSIKLLTGRHHQIRVQLSSRGWPIVGDSKYGRAASEAGTFPALVACKMVFTHPGRGKKLELFVNPENKLFEFFSFP